MGTQEYCAPELLLHSAPHSSASDVFALAVTLNEVRVIDTHTHTHTLRVCDAHTPAEARSHQNTVGTKRQRVCARMCVFVCVVDDPDPSLL